MEIKIGHVITFTNDKEYVVVGTATENDIEYYALINQHDLNDAMVCFFTDEAGQSKLNLVDDPEKIVNLIPKLYNSTTPKDSNEVN